MVRTLSKSLNQYSSQELEVIDIFLEYLINHVNMAPFNNEKIAEQLQIDPELVNELFLIVKKSFTLQKKLEEKQQWESLVNNAPFPKEMISTQDSSMEQLNLNIDDAILKDLNLLHIISEKQPLSKTMLNKRKNISDLYDKYSFFFEEGRNGLTISEMGKFLVKEYQSYLKLNSEPEIITYKNLKFKISREN